MHWGAGRGLILIFLHFARGVGRLLYPYRLFVRLLSFACHDEEIRDARKKVGVFLPFRGICLILVRYGAFFYAEGTDRA